MTALTAAAELAILGSGTAGVAAAVQACELGVRPVVVETAPRASAPSPAPPWPSLSPDGPVEEDLLARYIDRVRRGAIEVLRARAVVGAFPDAGIVLWGEAGVVHLRATHRILAPLQRSAHAPAFPGHHLPGVLDLDGLDAAWRSGQVGPGARVLIAGAHVAELWVAEHLIRAGAEVVTIAHAPSRHPLQGLARASALWPRLSTAGELLEGRAPLKLGHGIRRVEGRRVTLVELDHDLRPAAGTETSMEADSVVLVYGFQAETELSRLLGCAHEPSPDGLGLRCVRDHGMRTSVPYVYAAGEAGQSASIADCQGRLAALSAVEALGGRSAAAIEALAAPLRGALERHAHLARCLAERTRIRPGLFDVADDETLVCPCEGIALGALRAVVRRHGSLASDASALKLCTRVGMGACQGRRCEDLVLHLLGAPGPRFTPRPPLCPIPLGVFADDAAARYAGPSKAGAQDDDDRLPPT